MGERRAVSYTKEMRERAKRDGKGLACLDFLDKYGNGQCYFGPASDDEQRLVSRLILKIIRGHPPVKVNLGKPARRKP